MCRDNSYKATRERHEERWDLMPDDDPYYTETYHRVAGTSEWPAVMKDSVSERNTCISAHWGLIPFWTKNKKDGLKTSNVMVNARVETIFEKPAYKNLLSRNRCIIPSTGFFEHHHLQGGKLKVPFYIKRN